MKYLMAPAYLWDGTEEKVQTGIAFAVENGRVIWKGSLAEGRRQMPDAEVIQKNWLVLPGFIDAHDHGRAVSPTGFGVPDRSLELWLQDLWRLPALNHRIATRFDGLQLISSGVTTVLHSHNPNRWEDLVPELVQAAGGYRQAGLRCILCPPYLDQNKGIYAERACFLESLPDDLREKFADGIHDRVFTVEEYLEKIEELTELLEPEIREGWVEIQLHPNGGQWCSDEALLKMKDYADAHHMRIHMHLLETRYQQIYAQRTWGCSFLRHYADIGFLGNNLSCAHMIWLTPEDEELLAKYHVIAVNNPSSNIRLRSGVFPLRELAEKNVPIALGLDGCALDDDQDYLRELRIAYFNNAACGIGAEVAPDEPLRMATGSGAGIADGRLSPGVIKVGEKADFVGISVEELRRPYADADADLLDLLLHRGTRKAVEAVYVQGQKVYDAEKYEERYRVAASELTEEIRRLREETPIRLLPWKQEIIGEIGKFYRKWEDAK